MFQKIILKRSCEESVIIVKIALEHHSSQKYPGLLTMEILAIWTLWCSLNCVTPLVTYFLGDAYLVDVNPSSSYDSTIAGEVRAAFSAMIAGRKNPVSSLALKSKVGEFHHQFFGSEQNDSHEFLMYLLAWLHKDLRGGSLPVLPWWWSYISSHGSIRVEQWTLYHNHTFPRHA